MKNIFSLIFILAAENLSNEKINTNESCKQYTKTPDYYEKIVHLDILLYNYTINKKSFQQIADEFHICEKQLTNIIKYEYKRTAKLLSFEHRIKKAASLLKNMPYLTISEIAEKVGYGSPEILSIMFKKYYGVSAGKYRAEAQKSKTPHES